MCYHLEPYAKNDGLHIMLLEQLPTTVQQDAVEFEKIPEHIAFIMDGNRRWANRQGLPIQFGHWKGAEAIDKVIKACLSLGVKVVTAFAFSTENWTRPLSEVQYVMQLLAFFLKKKTAMMLNAGIRFKTIGDLSQLPEDLKKKINEVVQLTAQGTKMELVLAINYGSRNEMVRSVKKIIDDVVEKKIQKQDVTENLISSYLDTSPWKDPDLLIRTSGERRLSNFLLWQMSYTEICITDTLWPDFTEDDLLTAIHEYQQRKRRFGG